MLSTPSVFGYLVLPECPCRSWARSGLHRCEWRPSMATATGTKLCTKCGKDVTQDKRMKDSHGRYWCLVCGEQDQRDKQDRVACADCRSKQLTSEMVKVGDEWVCRACSEARTAGGGGAVVGEKRRDSTAEANRATLVKAIAAGLLLLLGVGLIAMYAMEII